MNTGMEMLSYSRENVVILKCNSGAGKEMRKDQKGESAGRQKVFNASPVRE